MNYMSVVCSSSRQVVHKLEEFEDSLIDTVINDLIHSNAKSSGIRAKLKTSSFHKVIKISYKIDTGSNSSMLPFHIFKILFPKSAKSYCYEPKIKMQKMLIKQECSWELFI